MLLAQHPDLCSFRHAKYTEMCSISFDPTYRHGSPSVFFYLSGFKNVSFKAQPNFQFKSEVLFSFQTLCGCFQVEIYRFCIHLHLIEEQLPPLLFPQVHLLHGHLFTAVFLAGDAHDTCGAFTDLDETVQVFPGVSCRWNQMWHSFKGTLRT